MSELNNLIKVIRSQADPIRAKNSLWYFKTGKGDYGEGDKFYGLTVPACRKLAGQFKDLALSDLDKLIRSKYHEERLIAIFILDRQFVKADEKGRALICKFYLAHTKWINNWDLVDQSAPRILGRFLIGRDKKILYKFARSKNIWERRIAILSSLAFTKLADQYSVTLDLAEILLHDEHDLIQKAVGWMLREVGNRSLPAEAAFLKKHYKQMPRTALRYAIEKFPEEIRQGYLRGTI
jgi:3-methyladenine DNA glycosylase AlkD